ncbi:MAG: type IV pilin-like G/H family protein [Coleofasciculus sp. G3-WIS-01]|uniref:type IV pilin-like G/H family protein n=1 Tax=Coleofasciculus sp. G3-WIS-01 TaxID=3069528 RepID=UPI003301D914
MKTELKAKFLQHLNQKKHNEGFTLIELLVVIIIIGILSAIALPSFLNQANKAKESEAKQYVGSMNRAEQAFYLEKNGFSTTISDLGLGIKTETANYTYKIGNDGADENPAGSGYYNQVAPNAMSRVDTLRSYIGSVATGSTDPNANSGETTTLAVLCQTKQPGQQVAERGPFIVADQPDCPEDENLEFIK